MGDMDLNSIMSLIGASSGSTGQMVAWIFANLIFGSIGLVAFLRGKKTSDWRKMGIGIALMIYFYFVSGIWLIYIVGIALTAALYFWRD